MVGCNSCQTKQRQDFSKKTSTLNIQPILNVDASNNLTDCVINTVDLIIKILKSKLIIVLILLNCR